MLRKLKITFFAVFALIGIFTISSGVSAIFYGYHSQSWPTTPGIIIKASWLNGGGKNRSPPCNFASYEYEVKGQKLINDRIIFGKFCFTSITAPYSVGQSVSVHYDPISPINSVLHVGIEGRYWFFIIGGLAFLLFGAGLIWYEKHLTHRSSGTPNGAP